MTHLPTGAVEMSELDRIQRSFQHLDSEYQETSTIRKQLIQKLSTAVMGHDLDFKLESSFKMEAFMSAVNSLSGLLNSQERSAFDKVKLSLQERKDEDTKSSSEAITHFLKLITMNDGKNYANPIDINKASEQVEQQFDTLGIKIPDTELEEIEA
jgi:hypothetical protein